VADQSIIIVGVGSGLSAAVARRFTRAGFRVGLISRTAASLDEVADGVNAAAGTRPSVHTADAGDTVSLTTAWNALSKELGPPAVAVYNAAGYEPFGSPTTIAPDQFASSLAITVTGALVTAQLAAPAMRDAQHGTILITGGGLATHPSARAAALAAGKAAVRNLAFTLAEELEPDGIHVATVTISGTIKEGTPFDPDRIADVYWALHGEPHGSWTTERPYGMEG